MDNYNMYNQDYTGESNQTEVKAPSFFMQFPYAFNPQKYGELMRTKTGSMIGFVTLFLAICTIITYISFAISFSNTDEIKEVLDQFPDFYLTDGEFYIEEDFEYDDPNKAAYIYLTDDIDEFTLNDAQMLYDEEGYTSVILVAHSNLVYENNGEYNQLRFSDISQFDFDKEWILQTFLPGLFAVISIGFVFYFVGRTFWYFFCALVYMLIGMICAKIFHKEFTGGVLYKTAVYAKVLMTAVVCLLSIFNFSFAIPAFVRTMITLAMMLVAFNSLPQKNDV